MLLLTNDGALARVLELPATGWLRRYRVRAHGSVTQAKLDALRHGITISGIRYGAIEATLERVQGSNLWLTFAIREGKNREVRTCSAISGLTVKRLIRVSFGPFQLGDLAEGAIEEVRPACLREQLGAARSRSRAPTSPRRSPRPRRPPTASAPTSAARRAQDATSEKDKRAKVVGHAWRAHEEARPTKKLRRKFHGSRRDRKAARAHRPGRSAPELMTDRKGRPVAVERFGQPPVQEPRKPRQRRHGKRPSAGAARPPRSPDRASGATAAPAARQTLMRIVGGRLRGRALAAPKSQAIRPTADRLRESLFNILRHAYGDPISGARVLDLFAGTGALGIEALSRGAAFALFVDDGAEARALMRENVAALGLGGTTRIFRRDATQLGPAHPLEPFSLAFLDPPYGQGRAEQALASARAGGWLVSGRARRRRRSDQGPLCRA